MNKESFGATLRALRERENLSVKNVIDELKRYNQVITDKTLYSYENDKRAASADMLIALCQIYKCNNILETFAGFEPDYSIPDDAEWKLIERYRSLDPCGQETVSYILNHEVAQAKRIADLESRPDNIIEFNSNPDDMSRLVEYFNSASAGTGIFIMGNEATDQLPIPNTEKNKKVDYAIKVSGNSMEPDFHDGDIALVSHREELNYGDVGIFIINNNAYIKEYGETELISRNPKADNIMIEEHDNIVCMGKVIGKL